MDFYEQPVDLDVFHSTQRQLPESLQEQFLDGWYRWVISIVLVEACFGVVGFGMYKWFWSCLGT